MEQKLITSYVSDSKDESTDNEKDVIVHDQPTNVKTSSTNEEMTLKSALVELLPEIGPMICEHSILECGYAILIEQMTGRLFFRAVAMPYVYLSLLTARVTVMSVPAGSLRIGNYNRTLSLWKKWKHCSHHYQTSINGSIVVWLSLCLAILLIKSKNQKT